MTTIVNGEDLEAFWIGEIATPKSLRGERDRKKEEEDEVRDCAERGNDRWS